MSKSRCQYLKEYNLLIECFSPLQGHKDFLKSHVECYSSIDINTPHSLLIDIRDWDIETCLEYNKEYIEFFTNSTRRKRILKIAFLTNTPNQVAQTMIFIDSVQDINVDIHVFSSLEAAISWINPHININLTNEILANFRIKAA